MGFSKKTGSSKKGRLDRCPAISKSILREVLELASLPLYNPGRLSDLTNAIQGENQEWNARNLKTLSATT